MTCDVRGERSHRGSAHYVRHINADDAAGVTAISGVEEHGHALSDHAHELKGFRVCFDRTKEQLGGRGTPGSSEWT